MSQQRAHIVIPTELVKSIDAVVGSRKRSQFIVMATERELRRVRQLAVLRKCAGAWVKNRHSDLEGPGRTAGFVRRLRKESDRRL